MAAVLTSKLSKQREAHADRPDFSGEDLRNVEVHGCITESSGQVSACIDRWLDCSYPWNAKYKNMKKIPNPLPTRLVVPAYSAVMAARHDVVTIIPTKPVMYMPRRELTLSWSQAPRGL